jgi:hypothetical protein
MRSLYLFLLIILSSISAFSQDGPKKYSIKGNIKDAATGETLLGATVVVKAGVGAVADLDGNYEIKVEPGVYNLKVTYVNYAPQSIKVKVVDKDVTVNIQMENQMLDEVEISANIGTVRETPVAISNIDQKKIQEELGGQDLPMLMNSTPGVYATQQGGGAGDSRITLRGFDQTNIAVLVDGVPVNDMENGAVYWSNWDGLSEITKTMQVQRGLGATKLAIASAGGTMNIITNGIDQKRQTTIKRDFGNNNYQRTSIAFNSGLIKNKFGVVFAGSYRTGDGWVEGTFINAWSYFVKFQWKVNSRHLLSLSANGAPQSHGQRTTKMPIGLYSRELASQLGVKNPTLNMYQSSMIDTNKLGERPWEYNPDLAKLNGQNYYSTVNFYHKPLFNLSHFWSVTDRITISTVGYASFGTGGGTDFNTTVLPNKSIGYVDLTAIYNGNQVPSAPNSQFYKFYGPEPRSKTFVRAAMNNHHWYGLLSTAIFKLDTAWTFTFGLDARYYRGLHYRAVYDLLGGSYFPDNTSDKNRPTGVYDPFNQSYVDPRYKNDMRNEGDTIGYNNDGFVNWGGLFSQIEYKKNKWTAFATATGSFTGYQRVDYFAKKDIDVGPELKGFKKFIDYFKDNRNDQVLEAIVGFNETVLYNGTDYIVYNNTKNHTYQHADTTFVITYNTNSTVPKDTAYIVGAKSYTIDSKEAKYNRTKKKWFPGFTIKGGVNYKINSNYNVYANAGVLSIAPKFNNVFTNSTDVKNREYKDAQNQVIISQEVGAGAKYRTFAANINLYYTIWNNKPVNPIVLKDGSSVNVNGVNASHRGVEIDGTYKIIKNLELEGAVSLADWIYTSGRQAFIYSDQGVIVDTLDFSAVGVHIGNAAQNQVSGAVKYSFKGFYIKPRYTFFGKNYSNFDPTSLLEGHKDRDSWRMPDYSLVDLNAGYETKYQGVKLNITASINNFMNVFYISDAQNNAIGKQTFDANSATVFIGQGRRYVVGLRVTF